MEKIKCEKLVHFCTVKYMQKSQELKVLASNSGGRVVIRDRFSPYEGLFLRTFNHNPVFHCAKTMQQ